MSDVSTLAQAEVIPQPAIEFDKMTKDITLYTGVVPFTYTVETLLERLEDSMGGVSWFLTLHVTGFGTGQQVFVSSTVPVTLGTTVTVPFPIPSITSPGSAHYGLQGLSNGTSSSFAMTVVVQPPLVGGGVPIVNIVNTTVEASWFIGVREIVITDPPIVMKRKD